MLMAVKVRIDAQQRTTFKNPDTLHIASPMTHPSAMIAINIKGQLKIATIRSVIERLTIRKLVTDCMDLFLETARTTITLPNNIKSSVNDRKTDDATIEAVFNAITSGTTIRI